MSTYAARVGSGAPIPVREFSTAAEIIANRRALHAKFFPPRPVVIPVAPPPPPPPPPRPIEEVISEAAKAARKMGCREVRQRVELPPEALTIVEAIGQMTPAVVRRIQTEEAKRHGVTLADVLSERRTVKMVMARQIAMWRVKRETTLSLPQIGRYFGGRDHTTVLHAIRQVEKRMATDAVEAKAKADLEARVNARLERDRKRNAARHKSPEYRTKKNEWRRAWRAKRKAQGLPRI